VPTLRAGSNSSIQQAAVRHIITGVVDALLKDKTKTFTVGLCTLNQVAP
jgi:hypothetical protein